MSIISGAFAPLLLTGSHGVYVYSGNLYAIGFGEVEPGDPSDPSSIALFKSTDAGATWVQVGSSLTVASHALVSSNGVSIRYIGCCIDADFPASPYAYVAYLDASGLLTVSRADLSADDWTATSSGGPDLTSGYEGILGGFGLERDRDTGEFAVSFSGGQPTVPPGGTVQMIFICGLGSGLSGWSGPDLVPGQDDVDHGGNAAVYTCFAMAKGTGGRIHAFAIASVPTDDFGARDYSIQHFLGRASGGSFGSAFSLVSAAHADASAYFGGSTAIGLADGTLVVLFLGDAGIDGSIAASAFGTSGASPSWSVVDVDVAGSFGLFLTPNSGVITAVYFLGGNLLTASFNGSTWDAGSTLGAYPGGFESGTIDSDTLHLVYSPDAVELDYASFAITGGGFTGQFIYPTSIPSGERFGSGAVDGMTCGDASEDPVVPGCGAVDTVVTTEDPRCAVQGFAL